MSKLSRHYDDMSFGDIATAWAAELADQPNAPSASDIRGELLSAFLRGEFGIDEQSRVTMPLVGGEIVLGLPKPFKKTDFPAPHQMMTRDDFREGMRQSERWRGSPVVEASFEELAEIPIESYMATSLAQAIKLCHISFEDFDALRMKLGLAPVSFWVGSARNKQSKGQKASVPSEPAAVEDTGKAEPTGEAPIPSGLTNENQRLGGSASKVHAGLQEAINQMVEMLDEDEDWNEPLTFASFMLWLEGIATELQPYFTGVSACSTLYIDNGRLLWQNAKGVEDSRALSSLKRYFAPALKKLEDGCAEGC